MNVPSGVDTTLLPRAYRSTVIVDLDRTATSVSSMRVSRAWPEPSVWTVSRSFTSSPADTKTALPPLKAPVTDWLMLAALPTVVVAASAGAATAATQRPAQTPMRPTARRDNIGEDEGCKDIAGLL